MFAKVASKAAAQAIGIQKAAARDLQKEERGFDEEISAGLAA
jgi:hypothetical protein